eukprot:130360_1
MVDTHPDTPNDLAQTPHKQAISGPSLRTLTSSGYSSFASPLSHTNQLQTKPNPSVSIHISFKDQTELMEVPSNASLSSLATTSIYPFFRLFPNDDDIKHDNVQILPTNIKHLALCTPIFGINFTVTTSLPEYHLIHAGKLETIHAGANRIRAGARAVFEE